MEALAIFAQQGGEKNAVEIAKTRKEIDTASSKRLSEILMLAEGYIAALQEKSGFRGELSKVVKMVKEARQDSTGLFTVPKWHIDSLFGSYGRCFPAWDTVPPHASIPIDTTGDIGKTVWHGIYMPETILYEDMCASYNLAARSHGHLVQLSSKKEIKTHNMAVRAAILAAYYFVEAYLNAVAFDHWFTTKAKLSQDDIDALMEWDSKKQRQRWLSFEEKTNRYPRIILGVQHSPLAASNCEDLKFLLNTGKDIRDSIVHASPKIDLKTMSIEKLSNMLGARLSHATQIVDSAIGYVRRLNGLLGKQGCSLDWLLDRNNSGQFPEEAFD